jgi:hypothetical protein
MDFNVVGQRPDWISRAVSSWSVSPSAATRLTGKVQRHGRCDTQVLCQRWIEHWGHIFGHR